MKRLMKCIIAIAILLSLSLVSGEGVAGEEVAGEEKSPAQETTSAELLEKPVPRKSGQHVIADFEGRKPVATNNTTHEASVTVINDAPEKGGRQAAKTVVDDAAAATSYFGTSFGLADLDLSGSDEIRFWIKTDIESVFNFQIHSGKDRASVFRFSTIGSTARTWKQITAPVVSFTAPPWAKGKADWTRVNKWQVTAFGKGPYDGKYIILDNVVGIGQRSTSATSQQPPPVQALPPITRSPNILLILTDDLGWRDLSCYGSHFYETPNIDLLASQGMRFTDAYAAATVCSPTRAAILTGKTPARLHLTDFLSGLVFPHAALKPPDWQRHYLPHQEVTLAEMLKQAGYETFYFGKWHLGGEAHFPATQGFDHTLAETQAGWPGTYFYPWPMVRNLKGKRGDYLTDRLTDEVIRSLARPHDRPFFTFLSYFTPHRPTQAKDENIEKYKAKLKPTHVQRNPVNAGMIHSLDENVGRIMRALEELKIADNTLLIFASDNGGNHYADTPQKTNNAPLRDGKGSAYEGAYRVPLIVRWPGKVAAGTETDEPVTSVDFFPTLRAVSGQEPAASEKLDGTSLLPLLMKQQPLRRKALYWHYPHYHHGGASPHGVIRKGQYRLIEHFDGTPAELYDVKNDIGETVNLVNTRPEKVKELLNELREWRHDVGAQMPTLNPDYDPDRIHEAVFYHEWTGRKQNETQ